MYTVYCGRSQV